MYCQWMFCITKTKLSSCNRDYMAHKAKNTYYLNLDRKMSEKFLAYFKMNKNFKCIQIFFF